MDFKAIIADFTSSFIIVAQRFLLLIFFPYQTMRKISRENDYNQVAIIFIIVGLYFYISGSIRTIISPFIAFLSFMLNFLFTVVFFYLFSLLFQKKISIQNFIFTFSYGIFPTLFWFIANSFFYFLIPPPRKFSIPGKFFSVFFISFSISLLVWRFILFYLSIRFSSRLNFPKIFYMIILYLCIFLPYSLILYHFKIFRIPFI